MTAENNEKETIKEQLKRAFSISEDSASNDEIPEPICVCWYVRW